MNFNKVINNSVSLKKFKNDILSNINSKYKQYSKDFIDFMHKNIDKLIYNGNKYNYINFDNPDEEQLLKDTVKVLSYSKIKNNTDMLSKKSDTIFLTSYNSNINNTNQYKTKKIKDDLETKEYKTLLYNKKAEHEKNCIAYYKLFNLDQHTLYNNIEFISFIKDKNKPSIKSLQRNEINTTLSKINKDLKNLQFRNSKNKYSYNNNSSSVVNKDIEEDDDFLFQLSHYINNFQYLKKKKVNNFQTDNKLKKGLTFKNLSNNFNNNYLNNYLYNKGITNDENNTNLYNFNNIKNKLLDFNSKDLSNKENLITINNWKKYDKGDFYKTNNIDKINNKYKYTIDNSTFNKHKNLKNANNNILDLSESILTTKNNKNLKDQRITILQQKKHMFNKNRKSISNINNNNNSNIKEIKNNKCYKDALFTINNYSPRRYKTLESDIVTKKDKLKNTSKNYNKNNNKYFKNKVANKKSEYSSSLLKENDLENLLASKANNSQNNTLNKFRKSINKNNLKNLKLNKFEYKKTAFKCNNYYKTFNKEFSNIHLNNNLNNFNKTNNIVSMKTDEIKQISDFKIFEKHMKIRQKLIDKLIY